MAISIDLFASRLDHACLDMEEAMQKAKRALDAELRLLGTVIEDCEPHALAACRAIYQARLADMERRLTEGA